MDKKEALKIILECAKQYNRNLSNNNIMFVCRNKQQQLFSFEVTFLPRNFLHLTGVKIINKGINSSIEFYRACLANKLDVKDFKYADDGTTIMKLNVLPQVVRAYKNAKMFGEYNNTKNYLFTEKITGNITACIGFVKDKEFYVPNTVLKEDIRNIINNETKATIIYIFMKRVEEQLYSRVTYIAESYNLEKLLKDNNIMKKIDIKNLNMDFNDKNEKLKKFLYEYNKYMKQ